MNKSIIRYILGSIVKYMGFFLILPAIVGLIYGEDEWVCYAYVAIPCIVIGMISGFVKPKSTVFYLKEGCIATSASWILLSVIGALPVFITGEIPNYIDALFEIISGFTTTGASILDNVERLSHASLFWRSFTHLVGGMGVLVFLLAILPLSGGSSINLMRAESPGPSVGKLAPKLHSTARILYVIYLGMTVLEFVLLLFGGMSLFEACNTAMATAGTGGFGIYNRSIGGFSVYNQWVVTIFMILFGINFNAYYLILVGQLKDALKMEEVKTFLVIIVLSIIIITINIMSLCEGVFDAITKSAFQVASIMSSTGFSTADFALWPQTSRMVLVVLMFIGACAGSTGGGIKVSRVLMLAKTVTKELGSYIHPRSVKKVCIDGKPVGHEVIRSTNVYFFTFILIFTGSAFIISFEDLDFGTTFTAVIATMNNIGPGMAAVGPTCNFGFFSPLSKIVLMLDMLAGRLELFPILMLFHPTVWSDIATKRRSKIKKLVNAGQVLNEQIDSLKK